MSTEGLDRVPIRALEPRGSYLPLSDHAFLGEGRCGALVTRDDSVGWLCLPRFDSAPLLAGILDHARGGRLAIGPDRIVAARQGYPPRRGGSPVE